MILHAVYLKLDPDHDAEELIDVMLSLAALVGRIEGFEDFDHGPNIDAEGKSPDHPYGFLCKFEDRAALERYSADKRHQLLGERLVALCDGGPDGIVVYDLDIEEG